MATKKPIPSINVPIQSDDGSINWAWYLYLQWLASGAGGDATTVSVKVNSTTTGEPGTNAEVTNVGDDVNVKLNFKIPRGAKGDAGDTGPQGEAATIQVGTTTTLPAGSQATVTNVGTSGAAVFNFGIPKGADGQGSVVDVKVDGTSVVTNNVANIDLSGKQNTISDLAAIRSGATKGATALQPTDVVNNVTSTTTNKPLSANMGKVLQDQINNHQTIGKFLSFWDCTTGLPLTNPQTSPYTYHTGDYYRIKTVASAGGTNYRPSGSSYTTGVASTTVETEIVTEGQVYYYDGTSWGLAGGGSVTVDNSTVSYNDNSELQAIGVIDNNSNAIKVWTGEHDDLPAVRDPNTLYNVTDDVGGGDDIYTKTEVDSLLSGKANTNLSNTPDNIDYVVAFQKPTAANNYTWYRKYKSGWVEQGQNNISNITTTAVTKTLPIEMSDTDYSCLTTRALNNNNGNNSFAYPTSTTTVALKVNTGSSQALGYVVFGFAAA